MAATLSAQAMFGLKGLVGIVTGGGSGIGYMIACGLASQGASVYITGRRTETLSNAVKKAQKESSVTLHPIQMDVTNKESITKVVDEIEKREGHLHILVNNAGQVGPVSKFLENSAEAAGLTERSSASALGKALFENESFDQWRDLYAINSASIFFVSTAFLGLLDKGNSKHNFPGYTSTIINISSISGLMKLAQNHFAYQSSKAAAVHLTKLLSTELALKKIPIRVNSIAPGPFASEMTVGEIQDEEATNAIGKGTAPIPARRGGTALEMAGTAVYLASPAAAYTNGQILSIDGGYLAVNPAVI